MKKSIDLQLTQPEKELLKSKKINRARLLELAPDEVMVVLNADEERRQHLLALIEFQSVPSLGIGFALELIEQGYYSFEQLKGKDPVGLYDAYEKHCGAWADPCVEDSYRLLAHYIEHRDESKRWWNFTAERKAYREKSGFPADRPLKPWYDLPQYSRMKEFEEGRNK